MTASQAEIPAGVQVIPAQERVVFGRPADAAVAAAEVREILELAW